ncbi:hypothetical protein [Gemmatimonas sp.]
MHRPVSPHLTRSRSIRFDRQSLAEGGLALLIAYAVAYAFSAF